MRTHKQRGICPLSSCLTTRTPKALRKYSAAVVLVAKLVAAHGAGFMGPLCTITVPIVITSVRCGACPQTTHYEKSSEKNLTRTVMSRLLLMPKSPLL